MYCPLFARKTQIFVSYATKRQWSGMVAESFSKYEMRVACSQGGLHSCGGLAHEGLNLSIAPPS